MEDAGDDYNTKPPWSWFRVGPRRNVGEEIVHQVVAWGLGLVLLIVVMIVWAVVT